MTIVSILRRLFRPKEIPRQSKSLTVPAVATILLAVLLLCATGRFSAGQALTRFEFAEIHMGTRFRIVLYARDPEQSARASRAAFDRIAQLDEMMSDYRQDSELMRLCAQAGGPPVKVSEELFRAVNRSQEIARVSAGAFDITVGPVVRLWRRARRTAEMPALEQLQQALQIVGYQKIRIDSGARTIQLERSGMLLDLGGIAKGFAADEAQAELRRHGIASALVAAGGDIAVSDAPPEEKGWTIGVASLEYKEGPPAKYLLLSNAGVSTSGDVEQFVEIGGRRYSHIVDPRTGMGIIGHSSATVVAPDATTSDGLATAISVLGPERGLQLIDSMKGAAALFVQATLQGIRTFESKSWKEVPKGKPKGGARAGLQSKANLASRPLPAAFPEGFQPRPFQAGVAAQFRIIQGRFTGLPANRL